MYKKESNSWKKHLDFILLDILCIQFSLAVAQIFRSGWDSLFSDEKFCTMAIVLLLVDLVVVFFMQSYKGILRRGYYQEFKETLLHVSVTIIGFICFNFITKSQNQYSRMIVILCWELSIILCYIVRVYRKSYIRKKTSDQEKGTNSLVILTTAAHAQTFIGRVCQNNFDDKKISGIVIADEDWTGRKIMGIPVISSIEKAVGYICQNWVDEMMVDCKVDQEDQKVTTLLEDCVEMGVTIHRAVMECGFDINSHSTVENIGGYTVISNSMTLVTDTQMLLKRLMDICGGLVGCLITVILFIFVAPIIYIKSPGPIFFSQVRVGKNGKRFKIYKFRSMYMDAEERKKELMKNNKVKDGMMFKMDNDPRIIKGIGNFIRKTSIDEFPQFFNILKGDMSLVGTRPPTVDEWEKYKKHHRKRLAIKPGLTGMWQVSGRSDITDFEEVVALDTKYIMEWTLELDIKILFKTVAVIFTGKGSQ